MRLTTKISSLWWGSNKLELGSFSWMALLEAAVWISSLFKKMESSRLEVEENYLLRKKFICYTKSFFSFTFVTPRVGWCRGYTISREFFLLLLIISLFPTFELRLTSSSKFDYKGIYFSDANDDIIKDDTPLSLGEDSTDSISLLLPSEGDDIFIQESMLGFIVPWFEEFYELFFRYAITFDGDWSDVDEIWGDDDGIWFGSEGREFWLAIF